MPALPTIILLEDDETLRDLVAEGLEHEDYTVVKLAAPDGLAPELERLDGKAILVADRRIGPDSPNGFEVAAAALDRYPALRVVYCSGEQLALKRRSLTARERSLLKPFAVSQLARLIRQLQSSPVTDGSRGDS